MKPPTANGGKCYENHRNYQNKLNAMNAMILEITSDESKKKTFTGYINELWDECIKNSDKCVITGSKPAKAEKKG